MIKRRDIVKKEPTNDLSFVSDIDNFEFKEEQKKEVVEGKP